MCVPLIPVIVVIPPIPLPLPDQASFSIKFMDLVSGGTFDDCDGSVNVLI